MSDIKYYVLDENHDALPEPDLLKWARWFETADRRVDHTIVGSYRISTVFLGLDHSFSFIGDTSPELFETMVFGLEGYQDLDMARCATWDQAVAMHVKFVERWKSKC